MELGPVLKESGPELAGFDGSCELACRLVGADDEPSVAICVVQIEDGVLSSCDAVAG